MLSGNEWKKWKKRPVRGKDTAFRVVDGEAVVVSPREGMVRVLNNVGTAVWELSDGKNSIADIIEKIMERFDVEKSVALADVGEFVSDLVKAGVLELKK